MYAVHRYHVTLRCRGNVCVSATSCLACTIAIGWALMCVWKIFNYDVPTTTPTKATVLVAATAGENQHTNGHGNRNSTRLNET